MGTCSLLTIIRVVADDMVSPTPVPQQESCIPGPRDNVAVSPDVRLWSGQTRHHVPVAKNYLRQLAYSKKHKHLWVSLTNKGKWIVQMTSI